MLVRSLTDANPCASQDASGLGGAACYLVLKRIFNSPADMIQSMHSDSVCIHPQTAMTRQDVKSWEGYR